MTLELPDGTEYEGYGKYLEVAKHQALMEALKQSSVLKNVEPMSTYGVCSYGLMQVDNNSCNQILCKFNLMTRTLHKA